MSGRYGYDLNQYIDGDTPRFRFVVTEDGEPILTLTGGACSVTAQGMGQFEEMVARANKSDPQPLEPSP